MDYWQILVLAAVRLGRAAKLQKRLKRHASGIELIAMDAELVNFIEKTRHVRGTARRRVLQGEHVPNSEKLFSIFEPHTQLYKRGKAAKPMQFGRQVLIYEDGAGFIAHAYLLPRDKDDRDVVVKQTRIVQKRHQGRIRRGSFDRGFQLTAHHQHPAHAVAGHRNCRMLRRCCCFRRFGV